MYSIIGSVLLYYNHILYNVCVRIGHNIGKEESERYIRIYRNVRRAIYNINCIYASCSNTQYNVLRMCNPNETLLQNSSSILIYSYVFNSNAFCVFHQRRSTKISSPKISTRFSDENYYVILPNRFKRTKIFLD